MIVTPVFDCRWAAGTVGRHLGHHALWNLRLRDSPGEEHLPLWGEGGKEEGLRSDERCNWQHVHQNMNEKVASSWRFLVYLQACKKAREACVCHIWSEIKRIFPRHWAPQRPVDNQNTLTHTGYIFFCIHFFLFRFIINFSEIKWSASLGAVQTLWSFCSVFCDETNQANWRKICVVKAFIGNNCPIFLTPQLAWQLGKHARVLHKNDELHWYKMCCHGRLHRRLFWVLSVRASTMTPRICFNKDTGTLLRLLFSESCYCVRLLQVHILDCTCNLKRACVRAGSMTLFPTLYRPLSKKNLSLWGRWNVVCTKIGSFEFQHFDANSLQITGHKRQSPKKRKEGNTQHTQQPLECEKDVMFCPQSVSFVA